MVKGAPDPPAAPLGSPESESQWLKDLGLLLVDASQRFGDVAWRDDASSKTVYAHKCIVYARATGSFQQRYLGVPHGLSESDLSVFGTSTTSFRTYTPSTIARHDSLVPSAHSHDHHWLRPSSTTSYPSDGGSAAGHGHETQPLSLGQTDISVFEAALEYFYTASSASEAFVVALDGFQDGTSEEEQGLKGVPRLRQDLLYCWRSKLYSDVSIVLEGVPGEPFAAHRAVLASRSPYFHALLLGDYADSNADTFTLPSPPFTPASTTFILGYIYTGTLDFSPRKFDLATSFEIWRGAAFLSLSTLQSAIEYKVLGQLNPGRAPRVLAFAHAPDVNCARLASAATPLVVEHFDSAWTATPHVGHLEYDVQKALVRGVCDRIKPRTVADAASRVARARRQLETERATWADHVRGMLDGVEEALLAVLAQSLPEVVASRGFVDLTEGVGFSTDVLEWLLTLVVKGLRDGTAPRAYQALVGSVLLREQGIMVDARVLVEDTRSGILSYIKRKWVLIRNAGGFDDLEAWCAKELADELGLEPNELFNDGPHPRPGAAKPRRPPQHLLDGIPSAVELPLRSIAAPRLAPGISSAAAAAPSRTTRLSTSTSSTTSRAPTAGVRPSAPRTPSTSSSTSAAPARRAVSTSAAPRPRPAAPTSTAIEPSARQSGAARPGRPPVAAPSSSTSATQVNGVGRSTSSRPASIRSVASTASRARAPSTTADRAPRGRASPTPSTASRRSVASTAATRTTTAVSATSLPAPARRTAVSSTAAPVVPRRPTTSPPPVNGTLPRRQPSTTSLRSIASARTTSAAPPPLRKPASSTSLASRRSASSTTLGPSTRRPPTSSTTGASAGASTVRPTARTRPPLAAAAGASRRPTAAAAAAAGAATASPTPGLPGTSLLAGIPCIVTVRAGGGDQGGKALRIKAQVRYIGGLVDGEGQWVGVEALESAIPPEAANLSWCDGRRGDVSYFCLTPASTSLSSEPPTRPTSPALRPPSRRAPRRSASPTGQRESGPRKGLFVRPDQIVYVL